MIKVKLRKFTELNGSFFTPKKTREFLKSHSSSDELIVTVHNMNYYKIEGTEYLIHVYDAYEVEYVK